MSEFSAKTIRAARKAKASRMGSADPHTKVDSSDWTPAEPLNADVKTGARPISRRAFKSGGKVCGEKAKANMGRAPRKSGGVAAKDYANAKVNRNVKDANQEREGLKHVGGFKKGGRTTKAGGGEMPAKPPIPPRRKDVFPEETKTQTRPDPSKQLPGDYPTNAGGYADQNRKHGGRTKKMDGGGMMPVAMAPAPIGMKMKSNRFNFTGAQGSPYKKGGKVAHGDEAMDRALIKKMVKPSARTGKADGGKAKYLSSYDAENEKEYGKGESALDRGLTRIANEFSPDQMRRDREAMKARRDADPKFREFKERAKKRAEKESMEDAGYKKGGRTARASGGKVKKGKTHINIVINAGKKDDGGIGMPPPPPGLPGGPMSLQRPMGGMPPGMPPMPPGMPAGGPPSMGQPPMPPIARKSGGRIRKNDGGQAGQNQSQQAQPPQQQEYRKPTDAEVKAFMDRSIANVMRGMQQQPQQRKSGGRITKVASSYRDMEAGAASGEGRLQKTDIAKRIPKKKEDGVIETDKRGYPNKVIGATGGRTAHKAGGKVYRSYKDMDAGAGSGMGRLEKEEIQKRKH